jgi:hypothetical protein
MYYLFFLFPLLIFVFAHFYSVRQLKRFKKKDFKVPLGYRFSCYVEDEYKKKAEDLVLLKEQSKKEFYDILVSSDDPEERYQKRVNRRRYEKEKEKAYWEEKRKDWF